MDFNKMSHYKVVVTDDAKADLDEFVSYILLVKKNEQAADSLLDDFLDAVGELEGVAGNLKLDDDEDLAALGYHRIHLKKHRYYLLYRIEDQTAIVDNMFHDLQDYKNHMI